MKLKRIFAALLAGAALLALVGGAVKEIVQLIVGDTHAVVLHGDGVVFVMSPHPAKLP